MAEFTAEKLAQCALDVNIVSENELRDVWSELGTHTVEFDQLAQALVRRGLVTNYQLDRLVQGHRTGFFYGDYKILYLVGAGTFARVYRATHRLSGEQFAIKVLRKRMSDIPAEAEAFRREGELGRGLKHNNIVAIHEVVSKGKVHFIVMDFIEGHNLRDFARVRGKFEPLEAAQIVAGMMDGLNYAFQQGVTHRDLKMSNVILSSDGVAKLADFGLAGLGGDAEDLSDVANPRTIDYAGLERATGVRKDDTRSDIFFAGCIFYQLLCGRPPLAETRDRSKRLSKSRYQEIKPISDFAPELPLPLVRVMNKAIEFDPGKRYQTPGEMLTDLKLGMRRINEQRDTDTDQAAEARALEGHNELGEARKIMIVESDKKMQDLLRELFKKYGYRVLVMSDTERLFQRFYESRGTAEVVLLSTGHIGFDGVSAFNRLGQETSTKDLPAVLLLGDKQTSWRDKASTDGHRSIIQMPVKSRELRQAVLAVLGNAECEVRNAE